MGIIADLSQLSFRLYDIWKNRSGSKTFNKMSFFEKVVNPTYSLLKNIHGDYLDIFVELRERVSVPEGLSPHTINWLNKVRSTQQFDRSELRQIEFPIIKAEELTDDERKDLNWALQSYSQSLKKYFSRLGDDPHREVKSLNGIPIFRSSSGGSVLLGTVNMLSKIIEITRTPEELALEIMRRKLKVNTLHNRDLSSVPDAVLDYLNVATGNDGVLLNQIEQNMAFYRYYATKYYNSNTSYPD